MSGVSAVPKVNWSILWCSLLGCLDFNFLPTNGLSTKPLKVKLLAGEQKATENVDPRLKRVGGGVSVQELCFDITRFYPKSWIPTNKRTPPKSWYPTGSHVFWNIWRSTEPLPASKFSASRASADRLRPSDAGFDRRPRRTC